MKRRALDALDPTLWSGDDSPPWCDCARAFPDLARFADEELGNNPKNEWETGRSRAADQYQSYAGIFNDGIGFWVTCTVSHPCDQTFETLREVSAFYPEPFPWAIAARLRGVSPLDGETRYFAIKGWANEAMRRAATRLPDNPAAQCALASALSGETWMGWTRTPDWAAQGAGEAAAEKKPAPQWGSLEIHLSSWECVPDKKARIKNGEYSPTAEEEPAIRELLPAFAEELFALLESDPLWTAGPKALLDDQVFEGGRPRWSDDDYPACFDRRGETTAILEARAINGALPADGAEPSSGQEARKPKPSARL